MVSSRKLMILSVVIFLVWVGIGLVLYAQPSPKNLNEEEDPLLSQDVLKCKLNGQKLPPSFWKTVNLQRAIPKLINRSIPYINVETDDVIIQGKKIRYLHARNPEVMKRKEVSVLLLHGKAYSAEIWRKLYTIQSIAAFGFYVVAINLPKPIKSADADNMDKVTFINSIISILDLKNPVIISPSLSGVFSLKYLLKYPDKLAGFVPVAPVGTAMLDDSPCQNQDNVYSTPLSEGCERIKGYLKKPPPDLSCIKVPTLIVYGEKDRGENSAKLCFLPNSQGVEIPNGVHAAYKSNPKLWHTLLYNFLSVINETLNCK